MKERLFDDEAIVANADAIGRDAMAKVLKLFADTCVEETDRVLLQIEAGDLEQARRTAHGIVGAAANCSAIELQRLAREIEFSDHPSMEDAIKLRQVAERSVAWLHNDLPKLLGS